jgi:hypothetical protein
MASNQEDFSQLLLKNRRRKNLTSAFKSDRSFYNKKQQKVAYRNSASHFSENLPGSNFQYKL